MLSCQLSTLFLIENDCELVCWGQSLNKLLCLSVFVSLSVNGILLYYVPHNAVMKVKNMVPKTSQRDMITWLPEIIFTVSVRQLDL